ncbi:hypothetical protein NGA_2023000, partial [Nannochloropsis gaditana CCMP526]|uniref:uncharacterized protein n=1 Tax=Nannochloropsis gaditana (strain CCMP526) TaxID=1093141 RepID=UPI00029F7AD8
VHQGGSHHAQPLPSPCRCPNRGGQEPDLPAVEAPCLRRFLSPPPSLPCHPPTLPLLPVATAWAGGWGRSRHFVQGLDEGEVLHDGNIRVSTHRLEDRPAHGQGLVPVRHRPGPSTARAHAGFNHPKERGGCHDAEAERRGQEGRVVGEGAFHLILPRRGQEGVGVEEQEDVSIGSGGAQVHLPGATGRGGANDAGTQGTGHSFRAVRAPPVHHDDFHVGVVDFELAAWA